MSFGQRLRTAMEVSGMEHCQLARAAKMDSPHLSHILSGNREPSFGVLQRLLTALPNVDARWLVGKPANTKG
jgi:transcriptional regulator with XRE-family HTH domain